MKNLRRRNTYSLYVCVFYLAFKKYHDIKIIFEFYIFERKKGNQTTELTSAKRDETPKNLLFF